MGLFRRRAQVSTVALQIYMVAGSYWCPVLRAGGFRIDPRAFGSSLATKADVASMPAAAALPLFPGERPSPQMDNRLREWITDALSTLSVDQSALVTKTKPPSLLSYKVDQMPEALIADTVTGVTPSVPIECPPGSSASVSAIFSLVSLHGMLSSLASGGSAVMSSM